MYIHTFRRVICNSKTLFSARRRLQELADSHDGLVQDGIRTLIDYADITVMDHADYQAYLTAMRDEAVVGI